MKKSTQKPTQKYFLPNPKVLTVSDARTNLYEVVKAVGQGFGPYEITQRSGESVILMSKDEYEGWMETVDLLSSPEEMKALREAESEQGTLSHEEVWKDLLESD